MTCRECLLRRFGLSAAIWLLVTFVLFHGDVPQSMSLELSASAAAEPVETPPGTQPSVGSRKAKLLEVRKIWDRAPHNAFTDLLRFRGRWYCAFREGRAHVSPDGALRVITSDDGRQWTSVVRLTDEKADLRDAKLSLTADGRLMFSGAAALHQPAAARHQSMAWFSDDGKSFSQAHPVADPNMWLWSVTWHKGVAYGIGYSTAGRKFARLYHSTDGIRFETLVDNLIDQQYPNETSLVFTGEDTCYCLLRRGGPAMVGVAKPPYTDWHWKNLGVRIGGPKLIQLPDGRLLAGVRLYDGRTRTSLCWIDPQEGKLSEFLRLPSGGDTSYPGMVLHDGILWVSYYASHEGKTSIYLAKVRILAARK